MFNRNYVRMMLLLTVILVIATVTYVNADRREIIEQDMNPDGTGWKVHLQSNLVETATVFLYLNKSTGRNRLCIRYTDVVQVAKFETTELNSNNQINKGAWSLNNRKRRSTQW